jgi:pimeloyl-ACP methyl ester carboxylesterase
LEHREDMTAFADTRVATAEAAIAVRTLGAGIALVLLPGLGRSSRDLDVFAEHLVTAGYRAILPEPRGMDGSTGRLDGITLHDLAHDIAAVIEALCDGPAVVIGHAFGNRIARCLASDCPDLVSLVVLLSSSGKVQPTPEIAPRRSVWHRRLTRRLISARLPCAQHGSRPAVTSRPGSTAGHSS